jgi:hypothetical protein
MTTHLPSNNPFTLEQELPFPDATTIHSVTLPNMLQWEYSTGGFFVEAGYDMPGINLAATFVTKEGKRINGFAAKTFCYFPIACRNRWEIGGPGKQQRLSPYQNGAHSCTQALGILPDGIWIVIASRGSASRRLVAALRSHRHWVAHNLHAQPFAVAIDAHAGDVCKEGATYTTEFNFTTGEEVRCPEALGWKVRERWAEVQTWIAQENENMPILILPAAVEFEPEAEESPQTQVYGDKTPVNSANADEIEAFEAYRVQKKAVPTSRDALREWVRNRRK